MAGEESSPFHSLLRAVDKTSRVESGGPRMIGRGHDHDPMSDRLHGPRRYCHARLVFSFSGGWNGIRAQVALPGNVLRGRFAPFPLAPLISRCTGWSMVGWDSTILRTMTWNERISIDQYRLSTLSRQYTLIDIEIILTYYGVQ